MHASTVFSLFSHPLLNRALIDIEAADGARFPAYLFVPAAPRGSAVVGGNVETSQRVVDVLLGAIGVVAASQGTMNNVTFGNERFGHYETIGGGAGAGAVSPNRWT